MNDVNDLCKNKHMCRRTQAYTQTHTYTDTHHCTVYITDWILELGPGSKIYQINLCFFCFELLVMSSFKFFISLCIASSQFICGNSHDSCLLLLPFHPNCLIYPQPSHWQHFLTWKTQDVLPWILRGTVFWHKIWEVGLQVQKPISMTN